MVTINSLSRHRPWMAGKVLRALEALLIYTCQSKVLNMLMHGGPLPFIAGNYIFRFESPCILSRTKTRIFPGSYYGFEEVDSRKICVWLLWWAVMHIVPLSSYGPFPLQWDLIWVPQDRADPNWSRLGLFASTLNGVLIPLTEHRNKAPKSKMLQGKTVAAFPSLFYLLHGCLTS